MKKLLLLLAILSLQCSKSQDSDLHSVSLELTKDGKGLMGTALLDFIKALPTNKVGDVANIKLSPAQQTDVVKSLLQSKNWGIY